MTAKYPARPVKPYLMTGDFHFVSSSAELEKIPTSVQNEGYSFQECVYSWTPAKEVFATSCTDFVFEHSLSQYSAAEIDQLVGEADLNVFVLGGSVASGASATNKKATWHALLETKLRTTFPGKKIYCFNAALGGYISTQEKLMLVLSVISRRPHIVLVLNGINDAVMPLTFGFRPGDPYMMSTLLKSCYGKTTPYHETESRQREILETNAIRWTSDRKHREIFLKSIANVYIQNMKEIIHLCRAYGASPLVFLQPWRDLSRLRASLKEKFDFPPHIFEFTLEAYQRFLDGLKGCEEFVDLSSHSSFIEKGSSALYVDPCHPGDAGQAVLAETIYESVMPVAASRLFNSASLLA